MRTNEVIALVERLLERAKEVGALQYGDFTLTSGAKSNFYFDGRLISTDPEGVRITSTVLLDLVFNKHNLQAFGGPAVGAVPVIGGVMFAAGNKGIPLNGFFVRSEPKSHGTAKQIEGHLQSSNSVALYDDTISTGGSLLVTVDEVRRAGADIKVITCILDRRRDRSEKLADTGIPVFNMLKVSENQDVLVDHQSISAWFN